jgi:hypothetical protein
MMEMPSNIIRSTASSSRTATARARRHRLPRGIGLGLAALASIGLWFALAQAIIALVAWASVFGIPA